MIKCKALIFFIFIVKISNAQQVVRLYDSQIPNSKTGANEELQTFNKVVDTLTIKVSIPTITVFLPPQALANGTAVLICPGGGYGALLTKREGSDVAKAFNKYGITAFVLKYRLPNDKIMVNKSIGPLQDALQALRLIRLRAKEWGIDENKVGIMGFSAGGHLAATVGTKYKTQLIANPDSVNLRPDFMILVNPLISFSNSLGHSGSRKALLGDSPTDEQIKFYSNELNINELTPQTFLVHASDDIVVPVENSIEFYNGLRKHNVSGELHLYSKGGHGFLKVPTFEEWFGRSINWMHEMHLTEHTLRK